MRVLPRFAETAERQFVGGLVRAIFFKIDHRPGIEHQAPNALRGKNPGRHASGMAGADNNHVVSKGGHGSNSAAGRVNR